MMLERRVRHRTHLARLLLSKVRVGRGQVGADGADDGAGGVGDGAVLVCVLEGGAGAGARVLDAGGGDVGVVVDDRVAVVRDFGVGDGAAGFGVFGVVVRGVGGQGGCGRADDGADLLGGGHGLCCLVRWVVLDVWVGISWYVSLMSCTVTETERRGEKANRRQREPPLPREPGHSTFGHEPATEEPCLSTSQREARMTPPQGG